MPPAWVAEAHSYSLVEYSNIMAGNIKKEREAQGNKGSSDAVTGQKDVLLLSWQTLPLVDTQQAQHASWGVAGWLAG